MFANDPSFQLNLATAYLKRARAHLLTPESEADADRDLEQSLILFEELVSQATNAKVRKINENEIRKRVDEERPQNALGARIDAILNRPGSPFPELKRVLNGQNAHPESGGH